MTNFDKLIIDVETNGAVTPGEAMSSAGKTLNELMGLFADFGEGIGLERLDRTLDVALGLPPGEHVEPEDALVLVHDCEALPPGHRRRRHRGDALQQARDVSLLATLDLAQAEADQAAAGRQAACHPGLIDADHLKGGSAKIEALLPMLDEVAEVRNDLDAGALAEALRKHPQAFDDLYVNMVAAGEAGGILDTILQRLATYIEKNGELDPGTTQVQLKGTVTEASGAAGTLESSGVATGHKNQHTWEINGSKGSICWDLEDPNHLLVYSDDAPAPDIRGFASVSVTTGEHPLQTVYLPPGHNAGWEYGHVHALHHFVDCVANDKPVAPYGATFEDGYRAQVIMDAVVRSSQMGQRIDLTY